MEQNKRILPTDDLYQVALIKAFCDKEPDTIVRTETSRAGQYRGTAIYNDIDCELPFLSQVTVSWNGKQITFQQFKDVFIKTKLKIFDSIDVKGKNEDGTIERNARG